MTGPSDVAAAVRSHLVSWFSGVSEPDSASVTFVGLEPIEILRFGPDTSNNYFYVTVGCSRYPMVDPSSYNADPVRGPRAEVLLQVHGNAGPESGIARSLAVVAAVPSVEGVVLKEGLMLRLGGPVWKGAPETAVRIEPSGVADFVLPEPASPVQIFSAKPVFED